MSIDNAVKHFLGEKPTAETVRGLSEVDLAATIRQQESEDLHALACEEWRKRHPHADERFEERSIRNAHGLAHAKPAPERKAPASDDCLF